MNHQSFAQLNQISPPQAAFRSWASGLLQRKCACGGTPGLDGECEACRHKRLQRQPASQTGPDQAPPIVHETLNAPGQPLDPASRAFFEPRLGQDFSRVRVHTGSRAAESARAVNALAYTVGRNVVFGAGQYQPNTETGRKLLAHELAHVVQQRAAPPPATLSIGSPAGSAEREAAQVASSINDGSLPTLLSTHRSPALARFSDEQLGARAEQSQATQESALTDQSQTAATKGSAAVFPICFAPSVFFSQPIAAGFGLLAEKLIEEDYCNKMGCKPGENYFDPSLGGPDPRYANFIIRHNPSLTKTQRAILRLSPMRRPDILTHTPTRQEYYEIKPDSIYGLIAGLEKLIEIGAVMSFFSLPYLEGTVYSPTPRIPLLSFSVGSTPVEAYISVKRSRAGLVQYELCLRTNWAKVALAAAIAALIILLIIIITEETGIPIPNPGKEQPVPGEPKPLPAPKPSPLPRIPRREPVEVPALNGGSLSATRIEPQPYSGPIAGSFNFAYAGGLPESPVVGQTYLVTIAFTGAAGLYYAVVPFTVVDISGDRVRLESANPSPLDVAPEGQQPHVIRPRNPASISLSRLRSRTGQP